MHLKRTLDIFLRELKLYKYLVLNFEKNAHQSRNAKRCCFLQVTFEVYVWRRFFFLNAWFCVSDWIDYCSLVPFPLCILECNGVMWYLNNHFCNRSSPTSSPYTVFRQLSRKYLFRAPDCIIGWEGKKNTDVKHQCPTSQDKEVSTCLLIILFVNLDIFLCLS